MSSLPHIFRDASLLELALTHSSHSPGVDNERLEFLGDAVLDLIIAEELFRRHPTRPEGELTELKATVVSRKALAEAAQRLQLERITKVGSGLASRALPRSVLANVYEAVLGAVYLDAGLEATRAFALTTLRKELDGEEKPASEANPKQAMQQLSQRDFGVVPTYTLLENRGAAHARAFLIAIEIGARRFPSAWGRTRKEAETWAAFEALLVLEESGVTP